MNNIRQIERNSLHELKHNIRGSASWHSDYDSAYIFVGGLNYAMNEGDIAIVFSQFGEIVDLRLGRDKQTGKSRGFAFLAYEHQASTVLAVDNFNGVEICGRKVRVDHVRKFKPPREWLEMEEGMGEEGFRPTGPDGRGWGKYRQHTEEELREVQQYRREKEGRREMARRQRGEV